MITLSLFGETLNVMTLGGLALAVGILVDGPRRTARGLGRSEVIGGMPDRKGGMASNMSDTSTLPRPWWMTALAVFCLASVVFLVPRDLFLAHTRGVEVWFGFEVRGAPALLTAPIHWAVFLVGAWGFWYQRPWILPCAAAYTFYIALSHLIWNEVSPNGRGWLAGLMQALAFSIPGVLLLRARGLAMRRVDRMLTGRRD